MLVQKFPAPCRIDYVPSPLEPDEDGVLDVGYRCGYLSDGRAYRLECWRMEEILMVTIMFSDLGISEYDRQDMYCLLELEELVQYSGEKRPLQFTRTCDDAETPVWALNIMLANNKGRYGDIIGDLQSYK